MSYSDPIQEEFVRFHERRPDVYLRIVRLARMGRHAQVKTRRKKVRGSMSDIFETIRRTGLSLDNDFRSRYARLVMEQEPDLKGFFVIRGLRAHLVKEAA